MDWSHFERLETQVRLMAERLASLERAAAALRAQRQDLEEQAQAEKTALRMLKKANAGLVEEVERASQNGALNKEIQLGLTRVLRKLEELQLTL